MDNTPKYTHNIKKPISDFKYAPSLMTTEEIQEELQKLSGDNFFYFDKIRKTILEDALYWRKK
jgi:hypothetical protein